MECPTRSPTRVLRSTRPHSGLQCGVHTVTQHSDHKEITMAWYINENHFEAMSYSNLHSGESQTPVITDSARNSTEFTGSSRLVAVVSLRPIWLWKVPEIHQNADSSHSITSKWFSSFQTFSVFPNIKVIKLGFNL